MNVSPVATLTCTGSVRAPLLPVDGKTRPTTASVLLPCKPIPMPTNVVRSLIDNHPKSNWLLDTKKLAGAGSVLHLEGNNDSGPSDVVECVLIHTASRNELSIHARCYLEINGSLSALSKCQPRGGTSSALSSLLFGDVDGRVQTADALLLTEDTTSAAPNRHPILVELFSFSLLSVLGAMRVEAAPQIEVLPSPALSKRGPQSTHKGATSTWILPLLIMLPHMAGDSFRCVSCEMRYSETVPKTNKGKGTASSTFSMEPLLMGVSVDTGASWTDSYVRDVQGGQSSTSRLSGQVRFHPTSVYDPVAGGHGSLVVINGTDNPVLLYAIFGMSVGGGATSAEMQWKGCMIRPPHGSRGGAVEVKVENDGYLAVEVSHVGFVPSPTRDAAAVVGLYPALTQFEEALDASHRQFTGPTFNWCMALQTQRHTAPGLTASNTGYSVHLNSTTVSLHSAPFSAAAKDTVCALAVTATGHTVDIAVLQSPTQTDPTPSAIVQLILPPFILKSARRRLFKGMLSPLTTNPTADTPTWFGRWKSGASSTNADGDILLLIDRGLHMHALQPLGTQGSLPTASRHSQVSPITALPASRLVLPGHSLNDSLVVYPTNDASGRVRIHLCGPHFSHTVLLGVTSAYDSVLDRNTDQTVSLATMLLRTLAAHASSSVSVEDLVRREATLFAQAVPFFGAMISECVATLDRQTGQTNDELLVEAGNLWSNEHRMGTSSGRRLPALPSFFFQFMFSFIHRCPYTDETIALASRVASQAVVAACPGIEEGLQVANIIVSSLRWWVADMLCEAAAEKFATALMVSLTSPPEAKALRKQTIKALRVFPLGGANGVDVHPPVYALLQQLEAASSSSTHVDVPYTDIILGKDGTIGACISTAQRGDGSWVVQPVAHRSDVVYVCSTLAVASLLDLTATVLVNSSVVTVCSANIDGSVAGASVTMSPNGQLTADRAAREVCVTSTCDALVALAGSNQYQHSTLPLALLMTMASGRSHAATTILELHSQGVVDRYDTTYSHIIGSTTTATTLPTVAGTIESLIENCSARVAMGEGAIGGCLSPSGVAVLANLGAESTPKELVQFLLELSVPRCSPSGVVRPSADPIRGLISMIVVLSHFLEGAIQGRINDTPSSASAGDSLLGTAYYSMDTLSQWMREGMLPRRIMGGVAAALSHRYAEYVVGAQNNLSVSQMERHLQRDNEGAAFCNYSIDARSDALKDAIRRFTSAFEITAPITFPIKVGSKAPQPLTAFFDNVYLPHVQQDVMRQVRRHSTITSVAAAAGTYVSAGGARSSENCWESTAVFDYHCVVVANNAHSDMDAVNRRIATGLSSVLAMMRSLNGRTSTDAQNDTTVAAACDMMDTVVDAARLIFVHRFNNLSPVDELVSTFFSAVEVAVETVMRLKEAVGRGVPTVRAGGLEVSPADVTVGMGYALQHAVESMHALVEGGLSNVHLQKRLFAIRGQLVDITGRDAAQEAAARATAPSTAAASSGPTDAQSKYAGFEEGPMIPRSAAVSSSAPAAPEDKYAAFSGGPLMPNATVDVATPRSESSTISSKGSSVASVPTSTPQSQEVAFTWIAAFRDVECVLRAEPCAPTLGGVPQADSSPKPLLTILLDGTTPPPEDGGRLLTLAVSTETLPWRQPHDLDARKFLISAKWPKYISAWEHIGALNRSGILHQAPTSANLPSSDLLDQHAVILPLTCAIDKPHPTAVSRKGQSQVLDEPLFAYMCRMLPPSRSLYHPDVSHTQTALIVPPTHERHSTPPQPALLHLAAPTPLPTSTAVSTIEAPTVAANVVASSPAQAVVTTTTDNTGLMPDTSSIPTTTYQPPVAAIQPKVSDVFTPSSVAWWEGMEEEEPASPTEQDKRDTHFEYLIGDGPKSSHTHDVGHDFGLEGILGDNAEPWTDRRSNTARPHHKVCIKHHPRVSGTCRHKKQQQAVESDIPLLHLRDPTRIPASTFHPRRDAEPMPILSTHVGSGLLPPVTHILTGDHPQPLLPPRGYQPAQTITQQQPPSVPQPLQRSAQPATSSSAPPPTATGGEDIVYLKLPPPPAGMLDAPLQAGATLSTPLPQAGPADAAGPVNLGDLKIKKEKKSKKDKHSRKGDEDIRPAPTAPQTASQALAMQIEDTQRKYTADSVPASPHKKETPVTAAGNETSITPPAVVAAPPPGLPSSFVASSVPVVVVPNANIQKENVELGKQEEEEFRRYIGTLIHRDGIEHSSKGAPGSSLTNTSIKQGESEGHDAFIERLLTQQQAMFQLHQEVLTRNHVETTHLMKDLLVSRATSGHHGEASNHNQQVVGGGGLSAFQQSKLLTESMDQRDKLIKMNDELLRLQSQQAALQNPPTNVTTHLANHHPGLPPGLPRPGLWTPVEAVHTAPSSVPEASRRDSTYLPESSAMRASYRSSDVPITVPPAAAMRDARVGSSMCMPEHNATAVNTSAYNTLDAGIQASFVAEGASLSGSTNPQPSSTTNAGLPLAPAPTPAQLTDLLEQAANQLSNLTEELNRADGATQHVEGVLRESKTLLDRRKLYSAASSQQEQQAMLRALRQQASEIESQLTYVKRYPREVAPSLRNSMARSDAGPKWLPSNDMGTQHQPTSEIIPPSPIKRAVSIGALNTSAISNKSTNKVNVSMSPTHGATSRSGVATPLASSAQQVGSSHELVRCSSDAVLPPEEKGPVVMEGGWEVVVPAHYTRKDEYQPPRPKPTGEQCNAPVKQQHPTPSMRAVSPPRPQTAVQPTKSVYSLSSFAPSTGKRGPQGASRTKSRTPTARAKTPPTTIPSSSSARFSMYDKAQPRVHAFHPDRMPPPPAHHHHESLHIAQPHSQYHLSYAQAPKDNTHNISCATNGVHEWELKDQRRFHIDDRFARKQHDLLEGHTEKRLEKLKLDLQGI